MTNPAPSEFDARVDGIFAKAMTDYFDLMHGQDGLVGKPYQDAKRKIQAEATAAIRAAVREIVPEPKPQDIADYSMWHGGFNAAIAEMLAGIGVKDVNL